MEINAKLNLVVPLFRGDNPYAFVHSMPLSRDTFEANYLLISKTFKSIHDEGLGVIAGPRVAHLLLREIAARNEMTDAYTALMNEIRRLSNVVIGSRDGWEVVPYHEAVTKKLLDDEDYSEVEGAIVFFIVASAMYRRLVLGTVLEGATGIWSAQTSSLNVTAFASSLPTSTKAASTGETSTPSVAVPV